MNAGDSQADIGFIAKLETNEDEEKITTESFWNPKVELKTENDIDIVNNAIKSEPIDFYENDETIIDENYEIKIEPNDYYDPDYVEYDPLDTNFAEDDEDYENDDPDYENPSKSHKCDQCDKSYKRKEDLKKHISSVHEGIKIESRKNHQCFICNKLYRKNFDLRNHIIRYGFT